MEEKHISRKNKVVKVTLVGSIVNFLLVIFKFIAGVLGNSAAMMADAVHSLSDFATDIVVLIFIRISSKPQDEDHKYGHGKFETLATAIIGVVLFIVGFKLLLEGGQKIIGHFFKGEYIQSPGMIALWAAIISIAAKEILYRYTLIVGKKENSQSVIANAWHHRSDAISSLGTALGIGGAILLGEKWNVLDPIAAVMVSFLIMKVALKLILPPMNELLEKSLPPEVEKEILEIVESVPGITDPHNLYTRRIGNEYAIEIDVRTEACTPLWKAHELTKEIEQRLKEKYGEATHINLHLEPIKEQIPTED